MTRPFTCDTRFRFLLRQFGAPLETAPSGVLPHFTPSNGSNSDEFSEGPGAIFPLPNLYIISSMFEWKVSSLCTFSTIKISRPRLTYPCPTGKDTILH